MKKLQFLIALALCYCGLLNAQEITWDPPPPEILSKDQGSNSAYAPSVSVYGQNAVCVWYENNSGIHTLYLH